MVLRMYSFVGGKTLMAILRTGSYSFPRSAPGVLPVWTSCLVSMMALKSHFTSASGLSPMPAPGPCPVLAFGSHSVPGYTWTMGL